MDAKQLEIILENHKHWLNWDCDGWENLRADLHNTFLFFADLHDANLSGADLHNAFFILC